MEYDDYQIGNQLISKEEIEKAVQKIINSFEENQKSYIVAKFILERSIEKLDEICIIKNF